MAHRPMMPSDSWEDRPADESPSFEDNSFHVAPIALDRLAVLLRHGDHDPGAAVALDLALNDIVEEACIATGATGAAVALVRGDEIICRATTGTTAPELGAHLDTRYGLSAICIQTREPQRCDDSEIDPRVNAAACRQLGLRSVLILPLLYGEYLIGIFEVFSPQPLAFGDRDIETLYTLAQRILTTLGIAAQLPGSQSEVDLDGDLLERDFDRKQSLPVSDIRPGSEGRSAQESIFPVPENSFPEPSYPETVPAPWPEGFAPMETEEGHHQALVEAAAEKIEFPTYAEDPPQFHYSPQLERPPARDYMSAVLTVLVIVVALLLGWMLGRVAVHRSSASRTPARQPVATGKTDTKLPAEQLGDPAPLQDRAGAEKITADRPPSATPTPSAPANEKVPPGGLVVYQDGKKVFELGPVKTTAASKLPPPDVVDASSTPVTLTPEAAGELITNRVEPDYPERAREQHVQGPVVLQAVVNEQGLVQHMKVVTGDSQLVMAAINAVRRWQFKPYAPKGQAVPFQTEITVNFTLPITGENKVKN